MSDQTSIKKTLTASQRKRFDECKKIIHANLISCFEVGARLTEIREEEFYLEDFETFEDFCQSEFALGRAHAYRLIEAAEVKNSVSVSPMGDTIRTERQARELAKVPEGKRIKVLKIASKSGSVTAESIKAAAKELTPEQQAEKDIKDASAQESNGVITDETGLPVPPEVLETWNRGSEVQKLLSALSSVKGALEKAQTDNDPLFRPCTATNTGGQAQSWATLICGLKDAYHAIKQAKPYAICPACSGKLAKDCTQCHNRGIVSQHFWKTYTSQETKDAREKRVAQLHK